MFDTDTVAAKFREGLTFADFVATGEPEGHHHQWHERYERLALDADQAALVGSFARDMRVLCLTGTWCGDCALQGAAMARIADASSGRVDLRFLSRMDHPDLQVKVRLNGGMRVPVTFFMAEDFAPVSLFGDRTLSRYRSMARRALGDDAVHAAPPEDPVRTVLEEVLTEFERVQLLLRLSSRLRERHGD